MMRQFSLPFLACAMIAAAGAPAGAASSLQVAPVRIDVPAGAAASKITLANGGDETLQAQVRVFKWVQSGGKDRLVETRDIVASPPMLALEPGKSNVVRIVRTVKSATVREEAYRLIVDQLPSAPAKQSASVNFVLRYSIPVFFNARNEQGANLSWSVESRKGKTVLHVANAGDSHFRIAGLSMTTPDGKVTSFGSGLVGYVLAGSDARFPLKGSLRNAKPGQSVLITAEGNDKPVQAQAEIRVAN
jgi:fimbrial chaperone protein